MKVQYRSVVRLLGVLVLLVGDLARAQPAPAKPTPVAAIVERLVDESVASEVASWLQGFDTLLVALPLEQLARVELTPEALTLCFDFGKEATVCRMLGGREQWVLTKKGEAKQVRCEARTIRVGRSVRFTRGESGLTGVRKGDLEVKWGLCWFDLSITIASTPAKVACDDEGRALLEVGADGLPRKQDGAYVRRQASRWVVIEAQGRRVELPIVLEPAPQSPAVRRRSCRQAERRSPFGERVKH